MRLLDMRRGTGNITGLAEHHETGQTAGSERQGWAGERRYVQVNTNGLSE